MKTKEEAKEFIKSTCDFVWVADTQILKNNDVLELMVEFANLAAQPKWISVEEIERSSIPDLEEEREGWVRGAKWMREFRN